jgi:uncharacterized damage-inducible protein DinB
MTHYSGKEMAESFRTVRRNTIQVAEDIPEDEYEYRAAPEIRTVREMLAHVAAATWWAHQVHGVDRKTFVTFDDWGAYMAQGRAIEQALSTKAKIVEALKTHGEQFAAWLETLTEAQLAEMVGFPPPITPPQKTRFEMLLGVKEHEMHHRGQLMLIERLLGIVPHLTRAREQSAART